MQAKEILEALGQVPGPADYPTADALIIKEIQRYRLNPDGRISTYRYQLKRVFRTVERDHGVDVPIRFNSRYQELRVLTALSIMRDGSAHHCPEYSMNQITPPQLQKAPYFTDFQSKIISHVSVEHNGYVELEYELDDKTPWQDLFHGSIPLRVQHPVLHRQIILEVPAERLITIKLWGVKEEEQPPQVTVENGVKRVVFDFRDLPLWDVEDGHPMAEADVPKLLYTDKVAWDDLANHVARIVRDATVIDSEIEKRVDELLKDIGCPIRAAYRLHKFVHEAIATTDLHPRVNHYRARTAPEVLRAGYGNIFEKAILLAAMLRKAGHETEVALSCPLPAFPEGALQVDLFRHVWVWIKPLEIYLRPDQPPARARRAHLEGELLLVASEDGINRLLFKDSGAPAGHRLDIKAKLTVKDDGAVDGSAEIMLSGIYNPYFQLMQEDTDKVHDWVKGFAGKLTGGAELDKFHFSHLAENQAAMSLTFKIKRLEQDPDHRFLLELPGTISEFGDFSIPTHFTTRMSTYALPGSVCHSAKFEITLPQELAIKHQPKDVEISSETGSLVYKTEVKAEEDKPVKITFNQRAKFNDKYVIPELYARLREILVQDSRQQNRLFLLTER